VCGVLRKKGEIRVVGGVWFAVWAAHPHTSRKEERKINSPIAPLEKPRVMTERKKIESSRLRHFFFWPERTAAAE